MHILLFDIDGTLLSSGGAGQAAMEAALRREFLPELPAVDIPTAGRTDRAICADLFVQFGLNPSREVWDRFHNAYLQELPLHLRRRKGLVLPGVRELLVEISQRADVLIGLLTGNFREGARIKLEHHELHHHFRCGGYGDHHLDRDDVAREAWNAVREIHPEAEIERTWVLGDTPADIRCARAIGAKVLAVATGMFRTQELAAHGPNALRSDFSETDAVLADLGL
jgi:phosphoglycolate phosphatase